MKLGRADVGGLNRGLDWRGIGSVAGWTRALALTGLGVTTFALAPAPCAGQSASGGPLFGAATLSAALAVEGNNTSVGARLAALGGVRVSGGLAITGELGYLASVIALLAPDLLEGQDGPGLLALALGPSYSFSFTPKFEPFVFAGYVLLTEEGKTQGGVQFGLGFSYWLGEHLGVLVGGRDQLLVDEGVHILELQFGAGFR